MKLQPKLILAFVIIVLLMGGSQALILQSSIEDTFATYLDKSYYGLTERMKTNLEDYYQQTGSWEDVQQLYFENTAGRGQGNGRAYGRGMGMNRMMTGVDLLLLDSKGIVIADSANKRIGISGNDLPGKRQDLVINGDKQGTLVLSQNHLQSLEGEFIQSAKLAIIFSSLIAAGLAVILSLWLARKMTNPLRELGKATRQIASGGIIGDLKINTNDEFRELAEAFKEMSRKLVRNEEARQALVADVAHELRTPLAIFQGKLEAIQEGAIQPTEEVILELTDEVYRLNRLVSDLQQLSLAEAGKLPLNKKTLGLSQLIQHVCSDLQWLADEKEITLRCKIMPEPCWLVADKDRITQVIVNLIGNALRHTGTKGVVEVALEKTEHAFLLEVSDNGPGIPEDVLPFIFDRFYKGDSSRLRSEGGSGLGLSIAKGFVEAHDGKIEVESEVGSGTRFIVTLLK